tara:strand:+ start:877 stop:1635 length:759 start_codon:yes stop_codon:yes gene_type:complete
MSQVDWAISSGIFLVYVLGLLIFLKPGLQQELEDRFLISIVEENLKDDVFITLEKTPLFINVTSADTGNYKISIKETLPFEGDEEDFAIINENSTLLNFDFFGSQNKFIRFDGFIEKNKLNTFWLLYLKNETYNNNNPVNEIEIESGENFTYIYGSTEQIIGIDYNNLVGLNPDEDALKGSWEFPLSKDFSIYLANTSNKQYSNEDIVFYYNENKSKQQTNIFVKEFKDNLLFNNGDRQTIILNLRVGEFEE